MLEVGDLAPSFQLPVVPGGTLASADLLGKRYVLYFYPADDTPGCTKEACGIRDRLPRFTTGGTAIFGVSPQGVESHQRFIDKYGLNFPLLADEGHALADAYGAFGEKNLYGNVVVGILRSTFVVGPDGRIEKVWPKVDPEGHADEILAFLEGGAAPAPAPAVPPAKPAAPKKKPAAKKPVAKAPPKPAAKPAPKKKSSPKKKAAKAAPKKKVVKKAKPAPKKKGAAKKSAPKKPVAKRSAPKKKVSKKAKKPARPVSKKKVVKKKARKAAKRR